MTESELIERERAGHRVKELANNAHLRKAFDDLQSEYLRATMACAHDDDTARRNLTAAAVIVDKVRAHLDQIIQDGALATKELEEIRRAQGSRRKVLGFEV